MPTPDLPPPTPAVTSGQGFTFDFDLTDVNLAALLWHLGLAIVIVLAGRWLAHLARRWVQRALKKATLTESIAQLAERATYYSILMGAVLVALAVIGVPTTSLIYTIGIVLVIFGVALQESLSSFAATSSSYCFNRSRWASSLRPTASPAPCARFRSFIPC